jgi:pimeloyl-ACP methyl ester carboxylesterase
MRGSMRRLLFALTLASISAPLYSQTPQVYQASIGAGTHNIHDVNIGSNCGGPFDNVDIFSVYWGTLTLLPELPLLNNGDGTWQPASVTESGLPTSAGPGGPGSNLSGGSTYTSSISFSGVVTTDETGVATGVVSGVSITYAMTSKETIDLNTGRYTWHRVLNYAQTGTCPQTSTETQDRNAVLPVTLSPANGVSSSLTIVNPAAANGSPFPLASNVSAEAASSAPAAAGLAADGASAAALVYESSSPDPVTFTLSSSGPSTGIGGITGYSPDYLVNPTSSTQTQYTDVGPINYDECTAQTGPNADNPPCLFVDLLYAPPSMPSMAYVGGATDPFILTVYAAQNGSDGSVKASAVNSIGLLPPPLVLVHGVWSSAAAAWPAFSQWLSDANYPHQMIFPADYGETSSLSFNNPATQGVLATTIANAISYAAQNGVIAQKVDVFAHSMGGLVTEYFLQNGPPASYSSYLPLNPVHQLITVGTPEAGSPFAAFLEANQNNAFLGKNPIFTSLCANTSKCTLGYFLNLIGKPVGSAVASLEGGLQPVVEPYKAIIGQDTSLSGAESELNLALAAFAPVSTVNCVDGTITITPTVNCILGTPNDTIVPAANQAVNALDSATINGIVHTPIVQIPFFNDTGETASSEVWSQAVYWLLNEGSGQAPGTEATSSGKGNSARHLAQVEDSGTTSPAPVLDLTGYTQVPASNVTFTPDPSEPLTIGTNANITATSSTKTLSEVLLFRTVSDPSDTPLYAVTQSPFSIAFTPTRLGTANFTAFAVFTDNTFASVPLNYTLQPSGNALGLQLTPPVANLPIGLTTTVPAQADFATSGLVNVTQQATYSARSGGTNVFSVGTNGVITTTGNGYGWLDVSYEGQTASAMITVGSCTYSLGPVNQIVQQSGGAATIQVATQDECSWTTDSGGATWVSLSNASGVGNGTISVVAAANNTGSQQTAFITLAGQDVAIIQPATACTYTLGTTQITPPASGASGSITVSTSCPIIATSSQPWVAATALSSSVNYFIAANTSTSARTAEITIGDEGVQVTQAGAFLTPTLTVTPSASSITTAQALTVTVAVNGGSGNPTPTGSVTLASGSYTSAATTLSSGSVTINVPAGSLAAGTDTLTASYMPDSSSSPTYNSASGAASVTVTVPPQTTPTVTVTPSSTSITTAQSLTVTVTVNGGSGNATPTGSVTLASGGYTSAAATLSGGSATISIPAGSLATGTDTLTVSYTPDSNSSSTYNSSTGSASITVTAPAKTTPTVTVTPSSTSITTAQSLTVTVVVSGASGNPTPTGTVMLTTGSYSAQQALATGSATFSLAAGTLPVGSDTLTATYNPDASSASTYASATQSVTVTVTTPVVAAPAVTLSPTSLSFASQASGSTSAAQTVTLTNSGTAALSITSISASGDFAETNTCGGSVASGANCAISATFTPTAPGSRTGALTITDNANGSPQTVNLSGTGTTIAVSTTSTGLTISSSGASTTAMIQLTPADGFTGTVNLTCNVTYLGEGTATDAPTCSLSPSQATLASGTAASTTLTISTTAANSSARLGGDWRNTSGVLAAMLFLGLVPRRRWHGMALLALLCVIGAGAIVGCGGGGSTGGGGAPPPSNSGTTTGSYNVTVTATSGTVTASTTIPLSVQ